MLAIEPTVTTVPPITTDARAARWSPLTRLAFRFCVLYFGIYVLMTQMLNALVVLPLGNVPRLDRTGPAMAVVQWTATHIFGVTQPLVILSGSGDKIFDWVQAFCFLVFAALGTVLWSVVARRRLHHMALQKWFRLFLRFALGATFVGYGAAKAIPLQMPYPPLQRLLEPFGHFSPMGVLWYSIGASRPYEIFTGCAELAAGILLFIPATATLGALVSLACAIQIFTLNMTYDVPVKLFSLHLILMSLFLLAPDVRRLVNLLVLNRAAAPSTIAPLFRTRRALRVAAAVQVVFGVYLVGMNLNQSAQGWKVYGGGAPKSPLYGVWNVQHMMIEGVERAPLVTDYDRFRRVIFDNPARMSFQRMDDTFVGFGNTIDMSAKTVTLSRQPGATVARFTIEQPAAGRLVLDGVLDGKKMRLALELFPREKFLLVSRGFNWVQEYPFNR
jgi:hypothetical protein